MKATLNMDNDTLKRASELAGVKENTSLVRLGLEASIARESVQRLADRGGTEENLRAIRRRGSEGS